MRETIDLLPDKASRPAKAAAPRLPAWRSRWLWPAALSAPSIINLRRSLQRRLPPAYKEIPTPSPIPVADGTAPAGTEWVPAQPSDAMLRGKWWEIYNEPDLNALEDRLNIDNQTIKEYFENYMVARAIVREARAQYYPTVTAGPSLVPLPRLGQIWETTRAASAALRREAPAALSRSPLTSPGSLISLDASAARFTRRNTAAQVSAADMENERLAEETSLAQYYFEIRGQDQLQKVLDDTVIADRKSFDLTQSLYETGVTDQISVVEARSTLESAQASATSVHLLRAQYEHAIAMLIGQPASSFSIPVRPMTAVPPPIPVGLPSQLLQRRPDIAAAERNMASANAAIGVAYAAFFPTVTLSMTGGLDSSSWKHLFDWPSRTWSLGVGASQTLYSAELGPGLSQFVSTYNADVATYRQTVLTAFQQVEDNLVAVNNYSRQIQQQQASIASTQKALDLEMGRYETGIDPYIDVVTLQTTLLTSQQAVVGLQISQMTSSVALIEALGGGWDSSQLPTPQQVSQKPDKADTKKVQ